MRLADPKRPTKPPKKNDGESGEGKGLRRWAGMQAGNSQTRCETAGSTGTTGREGDGRAGSAEKLRREWDRSKKRNAGDRA